MKSLSLLLTVSLLVGSIYSFELKEYEELVTFMAKSDIFQQDFQSHLNMLSRLEPNYFEYTHQAGSEFDCQVNTPFVPAKSVNALTPRDIKAVGAMGDSLTAALGAKAKSIIGLLYEYRGLSWSHGGDDHLDKVTTMPNILREFNPSLTGFSEGMDVALLNKQGVGLNAAVSGQEANHLVAQAKILIERFKQSKTVNVETDWKMITLFIGGNDLCDYCKDKNLHSPKAYVMYIQQALDLLKENLPKTFVNLVMVLNVTSVSEMNRGLVCTTLHHRECPCVAFPKNDADRQEIKMFVEQYHSLTADLVASGRYDQTDDFTVVLQPFFKDFNVPRLSDGSIDYSFFAPDCFHFSPKGHALAAVGLWNNMLERVGDKSTTLDEHAKIKCPTHDRPYFFTNKNSRA